jgi:hypothetical protein
VIAGTRVVATLWYVEFEHRVFGPLVEGEPPKVTTGALHMLSADPSGRDLHELARAVVLNGKARDDDQFAVTHSKRLVEVKGTAIAGGGGAN